MNHRKSLIAVTPHEFYFVFVVAGVCGSEPY